MQRKKVDISGRPKFSALEKAISEVEIAPPDDPVFTIGKLSSEDQLIEDDTLRTAVEFMDTNKQMKDLMVLLEKNRDSLEKNRERLVSLSEQIKFQAAQALK